MEEMTLQNILSGQGISISLTGMAIVFSGLLIITICITLLPFILDLPQKLSSGRTDQDPSDQPESDVKVGVSPETSETKSLKSPEDDEDGDIASVIAFVLQMEAERHFKWKNEFITINRDTAQQSMWGRANKMRSMPSRRSYAKV